MKGRRTTFAHAKLRAKQRYGLRLTEDDWDSMEARVHKGDYELAWEEPNNQQRVLLMWIHGIRALVVFSVKRSWITTFLPPRDHAGTVFRNGEENLTQGAIQTGSEG